MRPAKSYFWGAIDVLAGQFSQLIMLVVLSRLLEPYDFGLMAIVLMMMAFASTLIDGGLASALIQKGETTKNEESAVFYINILTAGLLFFVFWFSAPKISLFFNMPELDLLIKISSLSLVIDSIGIIHYTLLKKHLAFRRLSLTTAVSSVSSMLVAIAVAVVYQSVWCLVIQLLLNKVVRVILYWHLNNWTPNFRCNFRIAKGLYAFGVKIMLINLAAIIFNSIYTIVIGRIFPPETLGLYSRANSVQQMPTKNLAAVINRVSFSEMSKLRAIGGDFVSYYKKMIFFTASLVYPFSAILFLLSELIILLVLGEKWEVAVDYFRYLLLVGLTQPFISVTSSLLKTVGETAALWRIELLRYALISISILLTFSSPIEALIMGQAVANFLSMLVMFVSLKSVTELNIRAYVGLMAPPLAFTVAGFVVSSAFVQFFEVYQNYNILEALIFLAAYLVLHIVFRTELYYLFVNFLGKLTRKPKT